MAEGSSPDRGVGTFMTDENTPSQVIVRCVSLDDFAQSAPRPTAIKCDVEGAEIEVLRGSQETLRIHHPWILCELHSEQNDCVARAILSDAGYSLRNIDKTHLFAQYEPSVPK